MNWINVNEKWPEPEDWRDTVLCTTGADYAIGELHKEDDGTTPPKP